VEVAAWDRETGQPKWSLRVEDLKTQAEARSIHQDGIWAAPDADSAVAFAVTTAGSGDVLVGVDPETGKLAWTWSPSNGSKNTRFSDVVGGIDEGIVVVTSAATSGDDACTSNRRSFVTSAIDLATGRTVWEQQGLCAPRQSVDGRLLFDDRVLDAQTGEQIWHAEEAGEVLGATGSVILWASGAETGTNTEEPVLIDVLDPDAALPSLPAGITQRIYDQDGILRIPIQASPDEAAQLWTFRHGERSILKVDLASAAADSIAGSLDQLLVQTSDDGVNLLDGRGSRVAHWATDGSVDIVSATEDALVLSVTNGATKKWILLPIASGTA
jgi:outer membrane protein assembly factor BamB